jgi:hypothetical protein
VGCVGAFSPPLRRHALRRIWCEMERMGCDGLKRWWLAPRVLVEKFYSYIGRNEVIVACLRDAAIISRSCHLFVSLIYHARSLARICTR